MRSVFCVLKYVTVFLLLGLIALSAGDGFAQNRLFAGFKGLNLAPVRADTQKGIFDATRFDVKTTASFRHAQLPRPHFAGALGFRLNDHWRVEGELHHTYQGIHGGAERQSRLGLINFSYDINGADEKFKPYVSFGAGISDQSLYRGGGYGPALQQDTALAAQVGAGFSLMLNQNLSFSGDYRYLTTHGNDMAIQPDDSHALRFGVTYMLPHKRMIDPKFRRD